MITDKLRRRVLRVPQPADVRTGGERPWDLSGTCTVAQGRSGAGATVFIDAVNSD